MKKKPKKFLSKLMVIRARCNPESTKGLLGDTSHNLATVQIKKVNLLLKKIADELFFQRLTTFEQIGYF